MKPRSYSGKAGRERSSGSEMGGSTQPIKTGYLTKRGEVRKTWRKRWFQLEPSGHLVYFKDAAHVAGKPLGIIDLKGCDILEESTTEVGRPFAFSIKPRVDGERVYVIFADSNKDFNEWVEALRGVAMDLSDESGNEVAGGKRTSARLSTQVPSSEGEHSSFSSSLPLQIHRGNDVSDKKVLAERRQQRQRMTSLKRGLLADSDDSDFDESDEENKKKMDKSSSSLFRLSVTPSNALQYLLHPDNSRCGDCNAPGPEFISVPLGMVFCSKCAEIHGILPKEITLVKNCFKDNVLDEELAQLREVGNRLGNEHWEAQLDPDFNRMKLQMDPMLRASFIRKKYVQSEYVDKPGMAQGAPASIAPDDGEDAEGPVGAQERATADSQDDDDVESLKKDINLLRQQLAIKNKEIFSLKAQLDAAAAEMAVLEGKSQETSHGRGSDTTSVESLQEQLESERKKRVDAEEALEKQRQLAYEKEGTTGHMIWSWSVPGVASPSVWRCNVCAGNVCRGQGRGA